MAAYIAQNCEHLEGDFSVDDEPQVRIPHKKGSGCIATGSCVNVQQLLGELALKISALEGACARLDGMEKLVRSVQENVMMGLERVEQAVAFCPARETLRQADAVEFALSPDGGSPEGAESSAAATAAAAADRVHQKLEASLNDHAERLLASMRDMHHLASMRDTHHEAAATECAASRLRQRMQGSHTSESHGPAGLQRSHSQGEVPVAPDEAFADGGQLVKDTFLEVIGSSHSTDACAKRKTTMFGLARWFERCLDHMAELGGAEPPDCCGVSGSTWQIIGHRLENFALVVILLNLAFLWHMANRDIALASSGNELDQRQEDFDHYANVAFTIFFSVEIVLRIVVYQKSFFLGHARWWNTIDALLVVVSYLEIAGAISFLRAFRIFKVAKWLRVHRVFHGLGLHELSFMMDCLTGSLSLLFWCFCVIGMMNILFSLLIVQLLTIHFDTSPSNDQDGELLSSFGSVEGATFTLFAAVTGGQDWCEMYNMLKPAGTIVSGTFLFYVILFYLAVTNVVTSTFIDKAFKHAQALNAARAHKEHEEQDMADAREMRALFKAMDINADGIISAEEFRQCMNTPEIRFFFQSHGLKITDVNLFFGMLNETKWGKRMDLMSLVDFCLRVRGAATRIDLYMLEHQIHSNQEQILREVRKIYKP